MQIIASNVAQSAAATAAAEKHEVKGKRASDSPKVSERRREDLVVVDVEAVEAARSLQGNDNEESHRERQERSAYEPGTGGREPSAPKHIDIKA